MLYPSCSGLEERSSVTRPEESHFLTVRSSSVQQGEEGPGEEGLVGKEWRKEEIGGLWRTKSVSTDVTDLPPGQR